MYKIKMENTRGEAIELTGDESNYQVVSVAGTNPPAAQINLSKLALLDGAKFNSSKLNTRNLVITVRINGDVEANRLYLYQFCPTKSAVKVYYENERRKVVIDGYVETVEVSPFTNDERMQISIVCPNPYFRDQIDHNDVFTKVYGGFEFPFAIGEPGIPFSEINLSDALIITNPTARETGCIVTIDVTAECDTIKIRKLNTGENFVLNYSFQEYDRIIINTNKGSKSITLIRDAGNINLFSALGSGSSFFQIAPGDNVFDYQVDTGGGSDKALLTFNYAFVYGGV